VFVNVNVQVYIEGVRECECAGVYIEGVRECECTGVYRWCS